MDASLPLRRLRTLSPAERALYLQLFRSAGGDAAGSPVPGSSVVGLLQRSGLPQDALRQVWELADHTSLGSLDFEGFCVACRLCAHAQLQAPGAPLSEALVAEVPVVPPFFEGAAGGGGAARGGDAAAAGPSFDFEAVALGVDGGARGSPSRPPVQTLGTGAFAPASSAAGASGSDSSLRGRGRLSMEDDDRQGLSSAAKLVGALSDKTAGSGCSRTERLGREMLDVRRSLDEQCNRKSRLEQRIGKLRARLEACREERHEVNTERLRRQADLEHLWATLDFQRRQIQDAEREAAALREARQGFREEELARVERRFGALATVRASLEDSGAADAALAANQRAAQDLRSAAGLGERVRRALRQKLELQARQQLLLAAQQQAEQERSYAQKEVEVARGALEALQRDRVTLSRERLGALREAAELARDVGLGAGAAAAGRAAAPGSPQRRGVPSEPRGSPPGEGGPSRGRVAAGLVSAAAEAERPPTAMLAPPSSAQGTPQKAAGWAHFGEKSEKKADEEPGAAFWRDMLSN